jgi:predicted metal-dependent hydrolase
LRGCKPKNLSATNSPQNGAIASQTRYTPRVSKKSPKIATLIADCAVDGLDAHYVGYFRCFNAGLFYEAHDVLEELWLGQRDAPNYGFYKGLIQFAGAFVHLQKGRLRPAAALFRLSRTYLGKYPAIHERLDLAEVLRLGDEWVARLEAGRFERNPFDGHNAPQLQLLEATVGTLKHPVA